MSKIIEVLKTYEDFELAFLVRYKLDTYMQATQQKVLEYIKSRGLDEPLIESLIIEYASKKFEDAYSRCPRCKSTKRMSELVDVYNTNRYTGLDGLTGHMQQANQEICQVCGFMLSDPNNENLGQDKKKRFRLFNR